MNKRLVLVAAFALVLVAAPNAALAQDTATSNVFDVSMWIAIAAGFGMAIASAVCGIGQSRAIAAALEGMARNPSAAGAIRGALILGLVLIESLAIYTLLVAMVLLFLFAPAL